MQHDRVSVGIEPTDLEGVALVLGSNEWLSFAESRRILRDGGRAHLHREIGRRRLSWLKDSESAASGLAGAGIRAALLGDSNFPSRLLRPSLRFPVTEMLYAGDLAIANRRAAAFLAEDPVNRREMQACIRLTESIRSPSNAVIAPGASSIANVCRRLGVPRVLVESGVALRAGTSDDREELLLAARSADDFEISDDQPDGRVVAALSDVVVVINGHRGGWVHRAAIWARQQGLAVAVVQYSGVAAIGAAEALLRAGAPGITTPPEFASLFERVGVPGAFERSDATERVLPPVERDRYGVLAPSGRAWVARGGLHWHVLPDCVRLLDEAADDPTKIQMGMRGVPCGVCVQTGR